MNNIIDNHFVGTEFTRYFLSKELKNLGLQFLDEICQKVKTAFIQFLLMFQSNTMMLYQIIIIFELFINQGMI